MAQTYPDPLHPSYLDDLSSIWEMVKESFHKKFSRETIDLWFSSLRVIAFEDNTITLACPSEFKCKIIRERHLPDIEQGFADLLGFQARVEVVYRDANGGTVPPAVTPYPFAGMGEPTDISPAPEPNDRYGSRAHAPSFSGGAGQGGTGSSGWQDSYRRTDSYPGTTRTGATEPEREYPVGGMPDLPEEREVEEAFVGEGEDGPACDTDSPAKDASSMPAFRYEYTFDNFIIGASNKFAHAACVAVADRPAENYNPLFIYGQSGLGKTHLMYAIINELKRKNPNFNIIYIKGDEFTNELIDSLKSNSPQKFRDKYRKCDVLLIDDIQFIAGKEATQDEFFHTFNSLYEEHKQIILTSDRPPRDIKTLEDRLKTRFEWGLIADIQPPDLELRIAIIKLKAEKVNIHLPDDVLMFLAENLRYNVRQIEGAIKKLGALTFLSGRKLDMELARGCISELLGGAEPVNVTVDKIFSAVYKKYHVRREDIVGSRRTKEVAMARHITIYMIRTITDMSFPNIGKIFNRDHSTIMSSIETVERRKATDHVFALELAELRKDVVGG